jgi:hypothetical protein
MLICLPIENLKDQRQKPPKNEFTPGHIPDQYAERDIRAKMCACKGVEGDTVVGAFPLRSWWIAGSVVASFRCLDSDRVRLRRRK